MPCNKPVNQNFHQRHILKPDLNVDDQDGTPLRHQRTAFLLSSADLAHLPPKNGATYDTIVANLATPARRKRVATEKPAVLLPGS